MKLYNSYSQEIEQIDLDEINIYNCGPTVYNHIHIGNARPLIVFDVLYRYLKVIGVKVNYLHNLTDIDDKIINAAIREQKHELDISSYYSEQYADIRERLNISPMQIEKVSNHIDGMIQYIQKMVNNKSAYVQNGNVYFDTKSVKHYGCLSHRKLDDQIAGERIALSDDKKNETDFVLWKKTDCGIQWDSPWGPGRPGWHTECVYLIDRFFANNLTIHGGGIDLKFPHHENENAQHEALHNCGLSKIWMHIGHINVNQEKMSKSLNNFVLVKDLLKTYSYQTIRWFMYKTNYQNPLDFNDAIMNECFNEINKMNKSVNYLKTLLIGQNQYCEENALNQEFLSELDNNLNISNAITILQKILKDANQFVRSKKYDEGNKMLNEFLTSLSILGIKFENLHTEDNINVINQYFKAVNDKDFTTSDKLREILIQKGLM